MAIVNIDLVNKATGEKTSKGYKFVRQATVTSPVAQSGRADNAARIYEAMNDTGIPEIGDSHPDVDNCQLDRIVCVAIEPNFLVLDLIYTTWDPNYNIITVGLSDISMETSLIQTETSKSWATGSAVSLTPVSYIYPIGAENPQDPLDSAGKKQLLTAAYDADPIIPVAPLFIPSQVYTIRKRLADTNAATLEALNKLYQGTVNDDAWRGYGARTWLCTGLTWRSTDRNTTYNIEVRFQYKFDFQLPLFFFLLNFYWAM